MSAAVQAPTVQAPPAQARTGSGTPARPRLTELEESHGGGAYFPRGLTLTRGQGARLEDDQGRSYVDCVSGHGAACLGHGHPALAEAVAEQAGTLISSPAAFGSELRGRLLARLSELTGLQRFFLCNSGTEAVEAAIKYARQATGRPRLVAAKRGFHGRTLGALSATWEPRYRRPFEPLVDGVCHVAYDDLEAVAQALGDGAGDDVAAVLVEPIQGEGGVRVPSPGYLEGLRNLCDRHGVLLIFDEVQTGFGRTGRLLAHHRWAEGRWAPDLVALGKGIAGGVPMGALALRDGLDPFPFGAHGSTFGGNPLACAASLAVLETLVDEQLCERAERLGEMALARLREELADCRAVREIRGQGLMIGIDLRCRAGATLRRLTDEGLLALSAGLTVIRLLPPLVIDEADWHWALERLIETVRDIDLGAGR